MLASLSSLPSNLKYPTIFPIAATILPLVKLLISQKDYRTSQEKSARDSEQCYHEDWAWGAENFQGHDEDPLQPPDTEISPPVTGEPPLENFGNLAEVTHAPTVTPAVDRGRGSEQEWENSDAMSCTSMDLGFAPQEYRAAI